MAIRESMTELVDLVRLLINDPTGTETEFTDDEIRNNLDLVRTYYSKTTLIALPEPDDLVYKWNAPFPYWDKDAVISDSAGTVLLPEQANYIAGQFVLDEAYDDLAITGYCYDVYAVSADLLTIWAGRIGRDITKFSADGSSYEFAGEVESKKAMAKMYAEKSIRYGGVRVVGMVRNDYVTD